MKKATDLQYFIQEADQINDEWRRDATEWYQMYRGDQWDSDDKAELENQKRPALTFNKIRPIIRLLTGTERKTRYDIKVLPIGEGGDHDVARLMTGFIKQIELDQQAQYIYSEAYRMGLITGRGWIKVDVNYDRNRLGDITLESVDPWQMWVDPYAQKLDYSDARYIIRKMHLTEDEVKIMYPTFKSRKKLDKLELAPIEEGDPISQARETYRLYEIWYKEYVDHFYAIETATGDVTQIDENAVESLQQTGKYMIDKYTRPEVYYAVVSSETILEQDISPYAHNNFPYVPFFCEFTPRFGEEKPNWHSIITDIMDPQKEKNKKHSLYMDILMRFINKGYRFVKGGIENQEELDDVGTAPGFKIEMKSPEDYRNFEIMHGEAPDNALLMLGQIYDNEIDQIASVPPALKGYEESSRESGRTVMLRQQQGHAMLAPYQDNMRLTRHLVIKQIMALIPQAYTMNRMIRMISDNSDVQVDQNVQKKLQSMMRIQHDTMLSRYDVAVGETPSTPTSRQAEFMELMEMFSQGILPVTPNTIKLLIKSSDISLKNELLDVIEQEMARAQQQKQQDAVQQAIIGG